MDQGFVNPVLGRAWTGSTKDAGSIFKTILESEAPRLVLTAFEPYLKQGLTSLGVSDTRAASELASFDTGKFDAAMTAFKAWVTAITSLNDVSTLLGSTPDELRAKVNMTLRDSFLAGFDDVMKQAGDLTSSLDQMFSAEQVTNAQKLLSIAQDEYQAGLQYFSQLEQASKSLAEQTSGVLLGFDEQRAKDKGPAALAAFYETQLSGLQGQLGGATSVEQVQQIMSQILQYGQELWAITGSNQPRNQMSQQDVEQFIRDAEKKAQDEIAVWEKEVADKNAALKSEVDAMTTALTAATTTTVDLTNANGDLTDSLDGAAGAAAQLRDELDQASGALGDFVNSLGSFGAEVQRWQ